MTKRTNAPSPQQRPEVCELARWCHTFVRYVSSLGDERSLNELEKAIDVAASAGSVRQLRSLRSDLLEWSRGLSSTEQRGLEDALAREGLGGLDTAIRKIDAMVTSFGTGKRGSKPS